MENKIIELSNTLVNYSLRIKEGDRVLINAWSHEANPLVKQLIRDIYKVNGIPFVRYLNEEINVELMRGTKTPRMKEIKKHLQNDNDNYDAFIQIRYTENEYEDKDVDNKIKSELGSYTMEEHDIRINKRRWVLLNYPSLIDAYKAKTSLEKFQTFAFNAMTYDYRQMAHDLEPLKKLMERTDKVRIIGPNTDLSFSIKNINAVPCCGQCNIPDGEIYTAPVKETVNGIITYNTPSPYNGNIYYNVQLEFKDGQIIKATADNDIKELNEIFETDAGAKYVGEFAIGVNRNIREPIGDILYDEKIDGSIHFTPGRCYEDADNGNISSIHWDLVLIQRPEFGGGQIFFDDVLIREDGKFVIEELKHLN